MPFNNFKLLFIVNFDCNFIHNVQHWVHDTLSLQVVVCNFDVDHYKPKLFAELDIYFPDEIERSVDKRQAEFLAGRIVATQALLALGFLGSGSQLFTLVNIVLRYGPMASLALLLIVPTKQYVP